MANQQRREQIITAALQLFDARGYHATGMEHIAEVVGMRASSLYNHCSSKQEILQEIATSAMEEMLRTHARAIAGLTDPIEQLTATVRNHVRFHATQARRVRVTNSQLSNLEEPARSIVLQLRRDYVGRWISIVSEGVDKGVFTAADVKITCWALIDMGIGVAQWFNDDGEYTADELADMYAGFALHQLTSKPLAD
ncbi:TetR/AcrR family transcriptional regulator [Corynebacterium hindlerae]|uniref:TetR/AcrR family transcriptional regulator n=1 Tax=Corynebacterium hindlerae TaxID=699041 RepID=A0A7G5FCY7_9CORY|nr:TetR/AcrR family transcriptional regulator [Corynebacterium hindlerae]QMV84478.1 TetR/AcrR family transcriptional regulator [Corynebacterium hindlerae]